MIEKFKGEMGKDALIGKLQEQFLVFGNHEIAQKLAGCVELDEVKQGDEIITQDEEDNDMFFILEGKFQILVNRMQVASIEEGSHVGEMALIDPNAKRSATVIAEKLSIVAKISEENFIKIARDYPQLWRRIGLELSNRLKLINETVA